MSSVHLFRQHHRRQFMRECHQRQRKALVTVATFVVHPPFGRADGEMNVLSTHPPTLEPISQRLGGEVFTRFIKQNKRARQG